jgi:hypothetical protein
MKSMSVIGIVVVFILLKKGGFHKGRFCFERPRIQDGAVLINHGDT